MEKVEALKHYKFSLAFENTNEEDYVTEKFFQSLVAGMYTSPSLYADLSTLVEENYMSRRPLVSSALGLEIICIWFGFKTKKHKNLQNHELNPEKTIKIWGFGSFFYINSLFFYK